MIAVAVQRRENGTRGEAAGCGKTGRKRKRGLVLPIMVLVSGLLAEEAPALVSLSRVAFFSFFSFYLNLYVMLISRAYAAGSFAGAAINVASRWKGRWLHHALHYLQMGGSEI